jgi:hypothetical protein
MPRNIREQWRKDSGMTLWQRQRLMETLAELVLV